MTASATPPVSLRDLRGIFTALFLLGGASSLIYEVAWVRLLSLSFGVSVYAVSAVLSAFMGGLALGSWAIGRYAERAQAAAADAAPGVALLRLYAGLQLGVALCALASPLIFAQLSGLYAALDPAGALGPAGTAALRFALAVLALLIPTTLMGGTLPVAAALLAPAERERGATLGALYAANTFGAVVGTLAAGFVLIRFLGTGAALQIAAAGDLIAAGAALWLAQRGVGEGETARGGGRERARLAEGEAPAGRRVIGRAERRARSGRQTTDDRQMTTDRRRPNDNPQSTAHTPHASRLGPRFVLAAFAVSGFVSLALQVIWTRVLSIFSLNAVFSFSVMLATFLAGLAIGGALVARRADQAARPLALFGALQLGIGLAGVLALHVFGRLWTLQDALTRADSFLGVVWTELFSALVTMLAPTLLIGATFPVAARIYGGAGPDVGARVGRLYALNTLGAMLGSLVAAFVLIPWLGLQRSALALAALNLLIGAAALLAERPLARRARGGLGAALAAAVALALLLPPGVYLGFRDGVIPELKLYREGADATVAVFETTSPPLKISFVNGRNEVPTDAQSMRAFYMLGHLPALLRPDAREALVVSFGNGVATGSLATHPLERITAVELVQGQVEAAQLYRAENRGVLDDPRLTIVHEDGRNFLLRDRGSYDVITADATHPINSSSWALFTREFYTLVQARMGERGVFIQWLPFHDLALEDYRAIVATFRSVFPNTTLLYSGGIHTFLLATPEPLTREQLLALEQAMAGTPAGADLGGAQALASDLLMDVEGVARYTAGARIVTDDRAFFIPSPEDSLVLESFREFALR